MKIKPKKEDDKGLYLSMEQVKMLRERIDHERGEKHRKIHEESERAALNAYLNRW